MQHGRKKMRLSYWDYSSEGCYYLTLCSKNRKPMFSHIVGRGILDAPSVELTEYGNFIQETLLFLDESRPDMCLHKWVIMPNHVHLLISVIKDVGAGNGASGMPRPTNQAIPKIVSSIKRYTNRKASNDLWQKGYYDHIVRDEEDYLCKWQYIETNPVRWLDDDYYVNEHLEVE